MSSNNAGNNNKSTASERHSLTNLSDQIDSSSDDVIAEMGISNNPDNEDEIIYSSTNRREHKGIFSGYKGVAIASLLCIFVFLFGLLLGLWNSGKIRNQWKNDVLKLEENILMGSPYNDSFSQLLQSRVNSSFLIETMKFMGAESHRAGSKRNNFLAEYLANSWRSWGWTNVRIHKFNVSMSDTKDASVLELVNKTTGEIVYKFNTIETVNNGEQQINTFQAYSRAGNIENAAFLYIHYATKEDLVKLKKLNISICKRTADGRRLILIARLGKGMRSSKISTVHKYCSSTNSSAVAGMLIYPDPLDFAHAGTNSSDVYPNTWWLPGDAPVWGNVRFGSIGGGGNWETPGIPSLDGLYPIHEENDVQTPFPVQPISYDDARILLDAMDSGVEIPSKWKSALAKRIGPASDLSLRLSVKTAMVRTELQSVIAVLPGSSALLAPQTILLGNHRDAWIYGGGDPLSGSVIVHHLAKIIGQAYQKGEYRPRRSIVIASWDGEEQSLFGSAEFVSQYHRELLQSALAYVNVDSPIKGSYSLNVRSDSLLKQSVLDASTSVQLNDTTTLYDDWTEKMPMKSKNGTSSGPRTRALGGGSDHISFSYKYGIPSVYPEYTFAEKYLPNQPTYHTRYDNADYIIRLVDPGMQKTAILTRYVLDLLLKLVDSDLVSYSLEYFLEDVTIAVDVIESKEDLEKFNVTFDALKTEVHLCNESLHGFNYKVAQLIQMKSSKEKYMAMARINRLLMTIPRTFLTNKGIPGREYFHNIIYTLPNASNNGGVLPAIQSALQQNNRLVVLEEMNNLLNCIHSIRVLLQQGGLLGSPFNIP